MKFNRMRLCLQGGYETESSLLVTSFKLELYGTIRDPEMGPCGITLETESFDSENNRFDTLWDCQIHRVHSTYSQVTSKYADTFIF